MNLTGADTITLLKIEQIEISDDFLSQLVTLTSSRMAIPLAKVLTELIGQPTVQSLMDFQERVQSLDGGEEARNQLFQSMLYIIKLGHYSLPQKHKESISALFGMSIVKTPSHTPRLKTIKRKAQSEEIIRPKPCKASQEKTDRKEQKRKEKQEKKEKEEQDKRESRERKEKEKNEIRERKEQEKREKKEQKENRPKGGKKRKFKDECEEEQEELLSTLKKQIFNDVSGETLSQVVVVIENGDFAHQLEDAESSIAFDYSLISVTECLPSYVNFRFEASKVDRPDGLALLTIENQMTIEIVYDLKRSIFYFS